MVVWPRQGVVEEERSRQIFWGVGVVKKKLHSVQNSSIVVQNDCENSMAVRQPQGQYGDLRPVSHGVLIGFADGLDVREEGKRRHKIISKGFWL